MFVNNYCLPMNCIVAPLNGCGGIYLGNVDAAQDSQLLNQHKIGAVLQILDQSVPVQGAQKLWIMAEDSEDFPLHKYFDQSIRFIENQSKKTNVLIHCYAGISRSAAIVAAYMMQKYNWSVNQTMLHIQSKRRIVSPNSGFMKQLKDFERKLSNQDQQLSLNSFKLERSNYRPSSALSNYNKISTPAKQAFDKINIPSTKSSSRLDDFSSKLDQFRHLLRVKQKAY
ncbi:unnamed protein product [Paramecium octaurelia]|uniref:Protein-tyrosine-phosphatase n=1 Tax=Paramecium octaurelia TaxID=43137 RepID=A0A8S1WKU5_PAROT|nr:unnamed protein product [Paramecium octaurelia]